LPGQESGSPTPREEDDEVAATRARADSERRKRDPAVNGGRRERREAGRAWLACETGQEKESGPGKRRSGALGRKGRGAVGLERMGWAFGPEQREKFSFFFFVCFLFVSFFISKPFQKQI